PGGLPDAGVCLGQQVVELLAVGQALAELVGLVRKLPGGEGLDLGLEVVDLACEVDDLAESAPLARVEDEIKSTHGSSMTLARAVGPAGGAPAAPRTTVRPYLPRAGVP